MEQITLRIPEDTLEDIEREASEHGSTRSEYIRDMLETRIEYEREHGEGECVPIEEHERLQQEHNELQSEVDRVHREKRQVLAQREENQELKRYVEDELSWREQPLATRLKWWLLGKDSE